MGEAAEGAAHERSAGNGATCAGATGTTRLSCSSPWPSSHLSVSAGCARSRERICISGCCDWTPRSQACRVVVVQPKTRPDRCKIRR